MKRLLLALALALATLVVAVPAANAASVFRIVKIHYKETSRTQLDTEYVVIKNVTRKTRNIAGWTMVSSPKTDSQSYMFWGSYTKVRPGATMTLYSGRGTNAPGKQYWNATSPRWNNDGDYAVLKNSSGTVADTCRYIGGGTTAYC